MAQAFPSGDSNFGILGMEEAQATSINVQAIAMTFFQLFLMALEELAYLGAPPQVPGTPARSPSEIVGIALDILFFGLFGVLGLTALRRFRRPGQSPVPPYCPKRTG